MFLDGTLQLKKRVMIRFEFLSDYGLLFQISSVRIFYITSGRLMNVAVVANCH